MSPQISTKNVSFSSALPQMTTTKPISCTQVEQKQNTLEAPNCRTVIFAKLHLWQFQKHNVWYTDAHMPPANDGPMSEKQSIHERNVADNTAASCEGQTSFSIYNKDFLYGRYVGSSAQIQAEVILSDKLLEILKNTQLLVSTSLGKNNSNDTVTFYKMKIEQRKHNKMLLLMIYVTIFKWFI